MFKNSNGRYSESKPGEEFDFSELVPASFMTVKGEYPDQFQRPKRGRGLIGIEFGPPYGHYRGFSSPPEGFISDSNNDFDDELDVEFFELKSESIISPKRSAQILAYKIKDIVTDDLLKKGLVAFDFTRKDPPYGLNLLSDIGIEIHVVEFKDPWSDWTKAFASSNPIPYNSLHMRMNIAMYAIANPEKFIVRKHEL